MEYLNPQGKREHALLKALRTVPFIRSLDPLKSPMKSDAVKLENAVKVENKSNLTSTPNSNSNSNSTSNSNNKNNNNNNNNRKSQSVVNNRDESSLNIETMEFSKTYKDIFLQTKSSLRATEILKVNQSDNDIVYTHCPICQESVASNEYHCEFCHTTFDEVYYILFYF